MSLTRIDCHFYRGRSATPDTSSYVALNPRHKPGSLVLAGASAARENIGGQVACRLSLEHFVEGVLEFYEKYDCANGQEADETSVKILETAFRKANSSVYNFGHKLAAGGRMAASLIGLAVDESIIACGRVGSGSAYLFRGDELFPFFESASRDKTEASIDGFVGANSLVSVELASVQCVPSDVVLVFASIIGSNTEQEISEMVSEFDFDQQNPCQALVQRLLPFVDEMSFFMAARIGPETVYLSHTWQEDHSKRD